MKVETRVELAILLIGAVIAGGWVGLRIARKAAQAPESEPPATQSQPRNESLRIMTAQPADPVEPVEPSPSRRERKEPAAPVRALPASIEAPPAPAAEAPGTPAGEGPADPDMANALKLLNEGKKFEARAALTKLVLSAAEGPRRDEIKATLDRINAGLFFSRAPSPDAVYYKVKPGDSLALIAKRFKRDYYFSHLIMQVNGIRNPKKVQINQRLKIPEGTFTARVEKGAHRLIVFLNGHYIKEYPVSVGARSSPTPSGTFTVANNKQVEPSWTAPDGHVYKFGDPRNILGARWIGFEETDGHQGYGIHGTLDAASIGKDVSNGCIRMLNRDIEEVFTMLAPGDTVEIVE